MRAGIRRTRDFGIRVTGSYLAGSPRLAWDHDAGSDPVQPMMERDLENP